MTRKWEALKERIAAEQYSRVLYRPDYEAAAVSMISTLFSTAEAGPWKEKWRERLAELADEVHNRIRCWDVRCAGKLLELFPGYLPKKQQGLPFRVELVDNEAGTDCDWTLIW